MNVTIVWGARPPAFLSFGLPMSHGLQAVFVLAVRDLRFGNFDRLKPSFLSGGDVDLKKHRRPFPAISGFTPQEKPMSNVSSSKIDLIKELRLRRWARMYHVPENERGESWHPVVLEEMLRIDRDRQAVEPVQVRGAGFVPLAPQDFSARDPHCRFHPEHSEIAAPNVVISQESFDRISEETL